MAWRFNSLLLLLLSLGMFRLEASCPEPAMTARGCQAKDRRGRIMENHEFESFYKQGIVPEGEFKDFIACLKTLLPVTFRISRPSSHSFVQRQIEQLARELDHSCSNRSQGGGGEEVPSLRFIDWYQGPGGSAWQLPASVRVSSESSEASKLKLQLDVLASLGLIEYQEAVSMIPVPLLAIRPADDVLDLCASPGSKTRQILHAIGEGEGIVVANDVNAKRCSTMIHQLRACGARSCIVTNHDARRFPPLFIAGEEGGNRSLRQLKFDRILCDVPCSGDGTMRKAPKIWQTWSVRTSASMHGLQLQIARRGSQLLKPGGLLSYSTCSMNPLEDEAVVAALLRESNGSLSLVDVHDGSEDSQLRSQLAGLKCCKGLQTWVVLGNHSSTSSLQPPTSEESAWMHLDRCARILPHAQDTGGFFVAILKKEEDIKEEKKRTPSAASVLMRREKRQTLFQEQEDFSPFVLSKSSARVNKISDFYGIDFTSFNDQLLTNKREDARRIFLVSPRVAQVLETSPGLRVIQAGACAFERYSRTKWEAGAACVDRIVQESMTRILPHVRQRVVQLDRLQLDQLLAGETVSLQPQQLEALGLLAAGGLLVESESVFPRAFSCWLSPAGVLDMFASRELRELTKQLLNSSSPSSSSS